MIAGRVKIKSSFLPATPSWVIPGTYLENIQFLSGKDSIGCVELLFFLYDDDIRSDFLRELPAIRDFSGRFVFTAHLPDNLSEEHEELVELLSPLVKHFIVHPAADTADAQAQARYLEKWRARYGKRRFLLENTSAGRLEAVLDCIDEDAPVCMDTAHLLIEGKTPSGFARRYGDRIREVHLNGLGAEDGGDNSGVNGGHKPLRMEDSWLFELAPFLRNFSGIVNFELFSWRDVQNSMLCLRQLLDANDV
ncbi:MAG: TIM barrel protein [Spirochaetaceae bacterium]|nr:TIM barrel protein [Spirochaetaceae bacterium]